MLWDISIVYIYSAKAAVTKRYNSNTSELQVIELLESHVGLLTVNRLPGPKGLDRIQTQRSA